MTAIRRRDGVREQSGSICARSMVSASCSSFTPPDGRTAGERRGRPPTIRQRWFYPRPFHGPGRGARANSLRGGAILVQLDDDAAQFQPAVETREPQLTLPAQTDRRALLA